MREFQSLKLTYSVDFDENTLSLWDLLNNVKTSNQQIYFLILMWLFRYFPRFLIQ